MQCVFLLALVAALKADTKQQAKVNPVEKVAKERITRENRFVYVRRTQAT